MKASDSVVWRVGSRRAAILVCLACLLTFVTGGAAAQNSMAPAGDGMPPDEWLANEVQARAIDYHDTRNPDNVPERILMEIGVRQLEAGASPDRVAADIESRREAVQDGCIAERHLQGVGWSFICAAGVSLSTGGAFPLTAGAAGVLCGTVASMFTEFRCTAEERRLNRLQARSTSELLRTLKATSGGEDFWDDAGFADRTGLLLDDPVETVLDEKPAFAEVLAEHGLDVELKQAIADGFANLEARQRKSLEMQERSQEILSEMHGAIERSGEITGAFTSEILTAWAVAKRNEETRLERRRARTDLANAHAALGGAVALVGLAGPDAQRVGRRVLAVGDAVVSVHGAVDAFNAAKEIGANTNLATLALSGNLVGVGLGLIGSFLGTGPSADEIIIEEIGKLRQEVAELHGRFDGVHEHLDRVMERLDTGFELLSEDIAEVGAQLVEVQGELRTLGSQVDRVARAVSYTYVNMTNQHDQLMRAVVGGETIACTDVLRQSVSTTFLEDCRSHFDNLAALVAGDQSRVSQDSERDGMWLLDHPDRTANVSFREFKRLLAASGRTSDGLPAAVVGTEAWIELMVRQNEFLVLRQDLAGRSGVNTLTGDLFADTMRGHRFALRRYLDAVVEELRVFTGAEEPRETVFSALFAEARDRHASLRDLIESIQDDYYADGELFDGRTRTAGDGDAVIPETRYEDPYAWNRMVDFYPADELPEWLRFLLIEECRPGWRVEPERLAGDELLRFVHEDDLLPARLGMGEIGVCTAMTNGRFTNRRFVAGNLAVKVWFMPTSDTGCPRTVLLDEVAATGTILPRNRIFQLLQKVRRRTGAPRPILLDREDDTSACRKSYEERFETKRRGLSDYVRNRLEDESEFTEIARSMTIANAHLRSWLALALDDVRWRSETVDAILSDAGGVGFPDLEQLLRDESGYAWDVAEEGLRKVESLEEILRSGRMRDAVTYGAGHRYLTVARFRSLDGAARADGVLASR